MLGEKTSNIKQAQKEKKRLNPAKEGNNKKIFFLMKEIRLDL